MSVLSAIKGKFGGSSSDSEYLGPAAITEALYELSADQRPKMATLGEPRMVDRGGQFSSTYKIVVPVEMGGGYDVPDFEFALPDGLEDESAEFYLFLRSFGIDGAENIELLDGLETEVVWSGGTPVPKWN